jgi:2-aminobenzoylacetyl-CoA thioesterase
MDIRNQKKSHTFPQSLTKSLWVLGNGPFHVYLACGGRFSALVEAGVPAAAVDAVRQIEQLGVRPDFIVVTHCHGDHVTGLDHFRERFPGIRPLLGDGAAAFLSHPRATASIVAEDRHMAAWMTANGYAAPLPPLGTVPSLEDGLICRDGDERALGGMTLRFLAVQGHAPGNLAVFIPEAKALLASDCLGFYYPDGRFFPVYFTGYDDYMDTLDRLESLQPEVLGLGHYGFMRGDEVGAAFALARRSAAGLRERLRNDPRDEDLVVSDMLAEFYVDEMTLFSRENIVNCCGLLLRRSR